MVMFWKKSIRVRCWSLAAFCLSGALGLPAAVPAAAAPPIKVTDADNHTVVLNKPGLISVVIGTSEDSQNLARRAGRAMYPFQGLPEFQLTVVVDLRDSIASWVPSVVIDHMRRSLDEEAVELQPYYLKNGNKGNPRRFLHVVPDFKGTIVPRLNWTGTPDQLHAVIFGADGREIRRWESIESMDALQNAVSAAIQNLQRTERRAGARPAR